jgi:hypothetical protein
MKPPRLAGALRVASPSPSRGAANGRAEPVPRRLLAWPAPRPLDQLLAALFHPLRAAHRAVDN